ncbi:MAG TPA: long-chain fatty acid--CoA ligase, partial [Bacilli bacterium]|nr:long-chain fatty acid--CoA ligase [Bacilli bacterium]
MYIADQLKKTVELQPNSVITSFEGRVTTYEQFYQQAESLASHLQELGYQKEDILALALPNSDYFLVCYFACQIGGFSVLPINIKLTSREIEYILSHSQAKGLVYDKSVESTIQAIIPSLPHLKDIFTTNVESSSNRLENILLETGKKIGKVARADNDTAVIFYTSGTTGRPKGVMLTNRNAISIAQMWSESMDMVKHDRTHIVAPLYHCAASHVLSIPTIYAGGALVIEEGFSPEQTMKTMEEEDVTIFFGVPAMYNIMLNTNRLQEAQLPNLRLLTYGAAPMPYELVKKVKEIFPNVKVQNLYGQTENSPGATTLKDHYALTKIGSVGEPLPNCLVRIVGENGEQLQTGEVGEIIVKGPHRSPLYNQP